MDNTTLSCDHCGRQFNDIEIEDYDLSEDDSCFDCSLGTLLSWSPMNEDSFEYKEEADSDDEDFGYWMRE